MRGRGGAPRSGSDSGGFDFRNQLSTDDSKVAFRSPFDHVAPLVRLRSPVRDGPRKTFR